MNEDFIDISDSDLGPGEPDFVINLGNLQPPPPPEPDIPVVNCAFCHDLITPGLEAVSCVKCNTPHHISCWKASRRCSYLGCNSKRYAHYDLDQQAQHRQERPVADVNPDLVVADDIDFWWSRFRRFFTG